MNTDIAGRNRTLVMKIAAVLMLLCLGLGACGQTGPLYLPEQEVKSPAPQAEPAQPEAASPAASPATTPQ